MTRETAQTRLARLRRRLTVTMGLLSLLGIAGLAIVATLVDGQLRDDRFDAELQGRASRAAALVFFDDTTNSWNTAGILDDAVEQTTAGILVFDGQAQTALLATAQITNTDTLVTQTLADGAELGSLGEVTVDGRTLRAAGSPYFGDDGEDTDVVIGVVIAASEPGPDPARQQLLTLVWGAAAALAALSAAIAWVQAGRVVKPMGVQLDREEAFLATAAHELRTPLGRFRAVSESALLSARSLPDSTAKDDVVTDLRRLVQLNDETTTSIEDLLFLGRIEAGQLSARQELVRLDSLVADFEGSINELVVDTTTAISIHADPVLVHHAVSNVLVNARRHGRSADRPLLIEASITAQAGEAVVAIRDNGPGLTNLDHIFVRHHTSNSSGGLGLWIVRSLIEAQGGRVSAQNHPDGGACFDLRWPLATSR